MTEPVFICTDLDGTLAPNGSAPESPGARERFRSAAQRSETRIAYVTGRHHELALEAIASYDLPRPDYLILDVVTSIYTEAGGEWRLDADWHAEIGSSWGSRGRQDLERLFGDMDDLRLQPGETQNTYKLSYYTPADVDVPRLLARLERLVESEGLGASLIWSRDESAGCGLLDVLPDRATKRDAVEFVMGKGGFGLQNTVFAGDSGNDLPVLTSRIHSVLVANAAEEVRQEALRRAAEKGTSDCLYLARGGFLGMNGNYGAGILEGLVHFIPATAAWFC